MKKVIPVLVLALTATATADSKLHASSDIVTWDKAVTEAQCMEKGKAAILAVDSKLTTVSSGHTMVGTKDDWIITVDCMQSYKLNGAYVVVIHDGKEDSKPALETVLKSLGGKSEMHGK
jgi:prephenate dehydrogenase